MSNPMGMTDRDYEEMIDYMRADLDSGMQMTEITDIARRMIEAEGRNFDEEFADFQSAGCPICMKRR